MAIASKKKNKVKPYLKMGQEDESHLFKHEYTRLNLVEIKGKKGIELTQMQINHIMPTISGLTHTSSKLLKNTIFTFSFNQKIGS